MALELFLPTGQGTGAAEPATQYAPAPQLEQVLWPEVEKVPAAQMVAMFELQL